METTLWRSPYRELPSEREAPASKTENDLITDLTPICAILWLGSVVRVVIAIGDASALGLEPMLAAACVLCLPWVFLRPRFRRWFS